MVGMPRISCLFRGAEPCIIMLAMPITMLRLLTMMLIMLTIKLILSIARAQSLFLNTPMYLIIPCTKKHCIYCIDGICSLYN